MRVSASKVGLPTSAVGGVLLPSRKNSAVTVSETVTAAQAAITGRVLFSHSRMVGCLQFKSVCEDGNVFRLVRCMCGDGWED